MDPILEPKNSSVRPNFVHKINNQEKIWNYFQNNASEEFDGNITRLRFLLKKIPQKNGLKVLNIGVGAGTFEKMAITHGVDIYSLDIDKQTIIRLKESLGLGEKAKVGFCQNIPFESNNFHAVVVSEVIEHLNNSEMEEALAEIFRVLTSGGIIVGTVPANETILKGTCICPDCGKQFHRFGHQQSFNKHSLENTLSKYFAIEEIAEHLFLNFSTLNWKGKITMAVKKMLLTVGIHGSNESLYFCGKKK